MLGRTARHTQTRLLPRVIHPPQVAISLRVGVLRRVVLPCTNGERRTGCIAQHLMRLVGPILDVVRVRLARIGMTLSIEPHGHRHGACGCWFQMDGKSLLGALVDALGKLSYF